ncbi:hypothetical protein GGP41_006466 [Bipolaris sorokiniana]|uniref:Uncharacterized protein n=1 Tax=Cochliobolus sativus TaxID=45130 RepID=A0A8H5ZN32_COCSA|nr:hypothetical protein GGP41_006466 [Bipolaris sorokiniana]
MALGGVIASPEVEGLLDQLASLMKTINRLGDDFPEDAEAPAESDLETGLDFGEPSKAPKGYLYYFEIASGTAVPKINLFVPIRFDEGKGLQTYVSCLFMKGELDITTYLGTEAFYPGRFTSTVGPWLTKSSTQCCGDWYSSMW